MSKKAYIRMISEALERTEDVALLDLIWKLLLKSK